MSVLVLLTGLCTQLSVPDTFPHWVSLPEASLLGLFLILCPSGMFFLPFLSAGFSTSPFLELSLPLRKHFKVCLKKQHGD